MHTHSKTSLDEFIPTSDYMPAIIARFIADRDLLQRKLTIPYAPANLNRMTDFLTSWQETLKEIAFDTLTTQSDRIDYILLQTLLDAELRRLNRLCRMIADAGELLPFLECVFELDEARLSVERIDPQHIAQKLDNAVNQIEETRHKFNQKPDSVSQSIAAYAAKVTEQIRIYLEGWFSFYNGYDPLFSWWVDKPYQKLNALLLEYGAFLRDELAHTGENGIAGNPIGRDELIAELRFAHVYYSPEELIDMAEREMEWCRKEMCQVACELGYSDDWRAALDYVKSKHAAPGEQPYLVMELAQEAVDYIESNDLITVPRLAKECWRMDMMSPEKQKINPFFLGGEAIVVSFPTADMDHSLKLMSLRGNNRAYARATVHHELIPGHNLQCYYQERYRPYRQAFNTAFWVEGWTLHWEMLLWELGFANSPEDKMGMLFWRKHRCARIIFSLGFHLKQMTTKECIALLVDEVGHEYDNAEAEVRRSFEAEYDPLYQCAYLIGGKQMHALYHELTDSKKMTPREFHDAVMKENCMPIPILRALLNNQQLTPDFKPDWRFLEVL